MNEKMEGLRAWVQPGILITLLAYGASGVTTVIGLTGQANMIERDLGRVETRVGSLEQTGGNASARMAVMENQLGYVVETLKRIEARMEARPDRSR